MGSALAQLTDEQLFDLLASMLFIPPIARTNRSTDRRSRIVAELERRGWQRLTPDGRRWIRS